MARRVEVLIRSHSQVPPEYTVEVGPRTKSDVPGYDTISVTFSADGKTSKPMLFLLSEDGKTLAQLNKFDIKARTPKTLSVSGANARPARGGPESAPVLIVVFDDLECPYCARMHAQLFPTLLQRYKNQVRIVYLDFPLDQHPWAMHKRRSMRTWPGNAEPGRVLEAGGLSPSACRGDGWRCKEPG